MWSILRGRTVKFKEESLKFIFAILGVLFGCTSTKDTFSDLVDLTNDELGDRVSISGVKRGKLPYVYDGKKHELVWGSCERKEARGVFFLVIGSEPFFKTPVSLCKSQLNQAFFQAGYSTAFVYLPGVGESSGSRDFGGSHSIKALEVVTDSFSKRFATGKGIVGYWGYGESSISLFSFLRNKPSDLAVIVGGGVYDMEATLQSTNSSELKSVVGGIVKRNGEIELEGRSIAWDPSGLPKSINLYHGDLDEFSSWKGASSFRDSLATQGYNVKFSALKGERHKIEPIKHALVLKGFLK